MSIQILSENKALTTTLINLLTNYFPHPSSCQQNPSIQILTKYYSCTIPIKTAPIFPKLATEQTEESTEKEQQQMKQKQKEKQKVDGLIFLMEENQTIDGFKQLVQVSLLKMEPEFVVVLVSGKIDGEWKYQEEIASMDSFVPVIYEDLESVGKVMPKWAPNGGLLKQQQQQQYQIFTLLQMLQTTSWSNQTPIPKPSSKPQKNQPKLQQLSPSAQNPQKQPSASILPQSCQQQACQPTEQQLQKQMLQFQMLMQEMMQVKAMSAGQASHNEKKKKAQNILIKLAGFMGDH